MPETSLLGFKISADGVKTDPEKVEAVARFPRPKSLTELRAFIGLISFYRRFIPGFSTITAPLYELFRKDREFRWDKTHQAAFNDLKRKLSTAPILARPNLARDAPPFILYTDACKTGLGAILQQKGKDGKERVILYASRGTRRPAEPNYGATKLECLAVVWAVQKLRYYLAGRKFEVVTDHVALKWLMKMKDPIGLYARWITILQEYDMTITYRPGRQHKNVDAISRIPRPLKEEESEEVNEDRKHAYWDYISTKIKSRELGPRQQRIQ